MNSEYKGGFMKKMHFSTKNKLFFWCLSPVLFIVLLSSGFKGFGTENVLFESNFSDLQTKWIVWDDPTAENKPSLWRAGLAELSGIYNDDDKIATILLAGEKSWKDYTIESTLLCVQYDPYLTGFVFGYQDPEHFYAVGYNFASNHFELEVKTAEGYESLAVKEADFPQKKQVPLRLDYSGGRIRFRVDNQVIFDVEDNRYQSGQFGIGTSDLEGAAVLIGPVTVTSLSPNALHEENPRSEETIEKSSSPELGEILFKEDFSSGNLDKWKVWDDPEGSKGPSQWTIVLSEFSGIANRMEKAASSIVSGKKSWKDYSVQADLFQVSYDGYLSGLVFGYQNPDHFYLVGYNSANERFELEVRTPMGFEILSFAEMEYPSNRWIPLRVDFVDNRILFRVDDRIIFDIKDSHFTSGKAGLGTSGLRDGDILFRNFRVMPCDTRSLPQTQLQDLSPARRGAAVIYRKSPPKSSEFHRLIDHPLEGEEEFGSLYELDLQETGLPEEVVLCFPQGRFVEIQKIGFKLDDEYFPKAIEIFHSDKTPKSGFKPLTTITLKPQADSYQEFDVPPTIVKYLKVRITKGYDPEEIYIQEMFLKGTFKELGLEQGGTESLGKVQVQERESNNSTAEAQPLPLNTHLRGKTSRDDDDYFKLSLKDQPGDFLTLYIDTVGFLRPTCTLISKEGTIADPSGVDYIGNTLAITYTIEADDYYLKIVQPDTYMAIVYDDSSSMGESVPTVKRVLKGYLENLGEGLNLKLMKYAEEPVELSDFTHDPSELKKAIDSEVGAGGGTDTFPGLMAAIESVREKQGNRAVLAILDEIAGDDLEKYIKLWDMILDSGVCFTTIGVQGGWDEKDVFFKNTRKQIFSELAYASRGQFFHSPSDEMVEKSANVLFNQLTSPVEYRLRAEWKKKTKRPGYLEVVLEEGIERESAKNVELILDASNSMWGQIEGQSKIAIAKAVLEQIIDGLPEKMNVGLRLYGHRYPLKDKRACQDTELKVPIGPADKTQLTDIIKKIQPKGKTPLVYSVLEAAKDFKDTKSGSIILITDGIESCNGDIHSIGPALKELGIELRLHIVGFDIKEAAARAELEAIAKSTEGTYLDAKDSQELLSSLEQTLQIEYEILDEIGNMVSKGFVGGESVQVMEGVYRLRLLLEPESLEITFTVKPGQKSSFILKKEKEKWIIKEQEQ